MNEQTALSLLDGLNVADYLILGVVAVSTLLSLLRGFFTEAISLLSWVLAIWVALSFNAVAATWLAPWIGVPSARQGAAFVLLFVAVLVVGGLLSFVVRRLVRHTGLSGTDRMLGMLFGAARGAVLVIVLVLVAGVTTLPADPWWRGSMLIPYAQRAAFQLAAMLPPDLGRLIDFSATRAPAVATSAGPLPTIGVPGDGAAATGPRSSSGQ